MKSAYLFPGQGTQEVGMGQELYQASVGARAVFEEADAALGFSLSVLCFEGPETELKKTESAQPAIMTVSLAYLAAAREMGVAPPSFVAGHSLGEYTALVAAGALEIGEGLRLVRERGRLMQEASHLRPGGMAAVLGLSEEAVADICRESGVEMANLNAPGQVVISGSLSALARAAELAKTRGARRVIPLEVSGAFHSCHMEPAREGMAQFIAHAQLRSPRVPVIANTSAQPLTEPEAIREELLAQLCSCVQWRRSVDFMASAGVSNFLEVGPGQVLCGLVKRIRPDVKTDHVSRALGQG